MKLKNVRKTYHNKNNTVEALKGIDLKLDTKGLVVILGPSGCGKTTLLNIISGEDRDFEGELLEVPNINYLTQEFYLFESMSIFENLKIVTDDKLSIEKYLREYGLYEHRNKKVKKCSNGQKKRIQFIRALLYKPDLILCDEPTAALDHENAKMLMEALKEVSKERQVIIVTHDIALAEKYADRIVKMGKGIIESDKIIKEHSRFINERIKVRKKVTDTYHLVFTELKSRLLESSLLILLYLLASFMLFISINVYSNIKDESSYLGVFKNGTNIIKSEPKSRVLKIDRWGDGYLAFDQINYSDLQKIVENNESVIGIECFYDVDEYRNNLNIAEYFNIEQLDYSIFKEIDFPVRVVGFTEEPWYFSDKPLKQGYLIGQKENELITEHEKNCTYMPYSAHGSTWPKEHEYYRKHYGISIVDLIKPEKISILYGTYPTNDNEVIIAKDTAELLMKQDGYESLEELIGKTFYIGIESRQNEEVIEDYYGTCRMGEYIQACYRTEDMRYVDRFEVKIAGISNIENDKLNFVFFDSEVAKNPVLDYYVDSYENLYFDYVRIILDPDVDSNLFVEKLNNDMPMADSEYQVFNQSAVTKLPLYKQPSSFLLYCVSIFALFVSLIYLIYYFIRKRFIKEHTIMKMIDYSSNIEKVLHVSLISSISFVIFIATFSILTEYVNKIAVIFGYTKLLSFDLIYICLSFVLVFAVGLIIEFVIDRGKIYDSY